MLTEKEGDGPRVAVSARMRWAWTIVFEVALIAIMLGSDAGWLVRVVVIVAGTVFLTGLNAYWRDYGMPADGTP